MTERAATADGIECEASRWEVGRRCVYSRSQTYGIAVLHARSFQ